MHWVSSGGCSSTEREKALQTDQWGLKFFSAVYRGCTMLSVSQRRKAERGGGTRECEMMPVVMQALPLGHPWCGAGMNVREALPLAMNLSVTAVFHPNLPLPGCPKEKWCGSRGQD